MTQDWRVSIGLAEVTVRGEGWLDALAAALPRLGFEMGSLAHLAVETEPDGTTTARDPVTDVEIRIEPAGGGVGMAPSPSFDAVDAGEVLDPEIDATAAPVRAPFAPARGAEAVPSGWDELATAVPERAVFGAAARPSAAPTPPNTTVPPASAPAPAPPETAPAPARATPAPAQAAPRSPDEPPPFGAVGPHSAPRATRPPPPSYAPPGAGAAPVAAAWEEPARSGPTRAAPPPPVVYGEASLIATRDDTRDAPARPGVPLSPDATVAEPPDTGPPGPDDPTAHGRYVPASAAGALPDDVVMDLFLRLGDITAARGVAEASGIALRILLDLVPAGAGAVLIRTRAGDGLRFRAASGPAAGRLVDTVIPLERGIAGFVCQLGVGLSVGDARRDRRHDDRVARSTGYTTRAMLAVPVRADTGAPYGCVELLNPPAPFTDRDFAIATRVAASLGAFLHSVYVAR